MVKPTAKHKKKLGKSGDMPAGNGMSGSAQISERELQTILDASPVGILVFNHEERLVYANHLAEEIFGKELTEPGKIRCGDYIECPNRHDALEGCGRGSSCPNCLLNDAIHTAIVGDVKSFSTTPIETLLDRQSPLPPLWIKFKTTPVKLGKSRGAILSVDDITERKASEQKLKDSLAELAAVHESAPIAMMVVDRDRRVHKVNGVTALFAGRPAEEMIGMSGGEALQCLNHLDAPDGCGYGPHCDQCRIRNAVLDTFKNGRGVHDIEQWLPFPKGDGIEERCLLISTSLLNVNGLERVLVCAQDITERIKTEAALERKQEILNMAQELATVGSWTWNINTNQLHWSDQFYKILGYHPEEVVPSPELYWDLLHPDDLKKEREASKIAFEKPSAVYEIEHRLCTKNGEEKVVFSKGKIVDRDPDGKPLFMIGTTQDITELRKAERKIIEAVDRLNLAAKAAGLGIWDWDIQKDILVWDDRMYELYGIHKEDFSNAFDAWLNGLHPDDRKENKELVELARRGDGELDTEFRVVWPNGNTRHIKAFGQVLWDTDGNPTRMIGINFDITEKKEMEARIQQAQKMEAIGTLAGGIAHDFNNLLFPIIGTSEMLLEDQSKGTPEYECLEEICNAAKRGSNLVDKILSFSRQTTEQKAPIRIQEILLEVLRLIRSTIPSNIDIRTDIHDNCGLVMADPGQIHQVAMNLITNAYHAVEDNSGTITVSLKDLNSSGDFVGHKPSLPGENVILTVSDTGCGIDSTAMGKIFEPYYTTKPQGKGTGLGLSVVYGIIQEHGGDIQVSSKPGEGTTFTVFLPLMTKAAESVDHEISDISPHGEERILFVDDEVPIVRVVTQMLERLGYEIISKTGSIEALELFRENPDRYDLVITDMAMPNMTGEKLASELLSIRPDIPIIICTGFSDKINEETAKSIGIKGFLKKPVVKSEMAKTVRRFLDKG